MSTLRTSCYAAALLVSFVLVEAAHAQITPSVFVVGDSHVRALGPMLRTELDAAGFRYLGYESRPGWSTGRYRQAGDLRQLLVRAGRPNVVVVSLGGNDFVRSREEYEAQLAWVIAQAEAAGAEHVVWVGPAASDVHAGRIAAATSDRHERNAELQRELLPTLGVGWIDSRDCTRHDHSRDGVHFTRTGYSSWCRLLAPKIHGLARVAAGPVS